MRSLLKCFTPGPAALTLAGITIPHDVEPLHTMLCGTTGTGKSTAVEELLDGIFRRGNRAILCDPNGGYYQRFARPGDVLLNAFDARSPGWSVFNEMRTDYDAERLAASVVPDGQGDAAPWHHYAQVLLSEVLRVLIRRGETTSERLIYWSGTASAKDLGELLAGTPATGLFDADAAKALASARFVLTAHLAPQRFIKPGEFSLRNWLEGGTGSLYLTWRADMQKALAPMLATWVDIVANAALALLPDRGRRLWLIVDELAALGRLNSLESALTLGRKHGLCIVAGLQSIAQLDRLYGRDAAITLRACFRNLLVLGIAKSDPDTCEVLSRALGEREIMRIEEARSTGALGNSINQSTRRNIERVVLPAEIAALPDLTGYLALAGAAPVRKITLIPHQRKQVAAPFQELAC